MGRQRVSRGRPNDYDWELSRGTDLARASGQVVQFEAFISDTAETLMRFRGDVIITLDSAGQTLGDVLVVGWGLIRSASGSSDVGVSPLFEGGAPWLAYGVATLSNESAAIESLGLSGASMLRWDVDSKAMRKLRENESIYVIFESVSVSGSPNANYAFALRGLTAR